MKTCLIVEDSEVVRSIAREIVENLELSAVEADDASTGVEQLREAQPDVVLLDWNLPDMGGIDFLRQLKSYDASDKPVVVLCATEYDPQQFALARAAGAAHYILKPYDQGSVREKLSEIGVV